jgi:hypothetical protein
MIKKVVLGSFLCLFSSFPAFCQQVDELVKQSLAYFEQADFQRFEEIYQRIYIAYLKENLPLYEAAAEATEKGNNELVFECLNELIDEGCFLDEIADDEKFKTLHGKEGWNVLLQKISVITEGYNEELRRELRRIQNRDQGIRILYLRIKDDSPGAAVHDYMKTVVDPDCAERVCRIL